MTAAKSIRLACSIDGCESPVRTRGWCVRHYGRFLRYGDPLTLRREPPDPNPPAVCTVDGCERPYVARGLCRMHYSRRDRGKPIGTAESLRNPDALCQVDGCDRRARMWGYCPLHGQRFYKHGDPDSLGWGTMTDDTETVLYRLWDESGALLYVGVTCDISRRFIQHSRVQPWWDEVAEYGAVAIPTRSAAFDLERETVAAEMPRYNVKLRQVS